MKEFFYRALPLSARKSLYPLIRPGEYRVMQARKKEINEEGYSLKPYIDNRCIFVHIPKTGGTAVVKSMFSCMAGGHITLKKYQLIFSEFEFDNFFKFAFVRNPWDRVVSAFNFLRAGGMNDKDADWAKNNLEKYTSFNDFVENGLVRRDVLKEIHFRPQFEFVCLPGRRYPTVDFLGRFENLKEDFDYVKGKIGGLEDAMLLERNKGPASGKKTYREYYTGEIANIVSNIYANDIKIFGYDY